jgi:hypothetical protein
MRVPPRPSRHGYRTSGDRRRSASSCGCARWPNSASSTLGDGVRRVVTPCVRQVYRLIADVEISCETAKSVPDAIAHKPGRVRNSGRNLGCLLASVSGTRGFEHAGSIVGGSSKPQDQARVVLRSLALFPASPDGRHGQLSFESIRAVGRPVVRVP